MIYGDDIPCRLHYLINYFKDINIILSVPGVTLAYVGTFGTKSVVSVGNIEVTDLSNGWKT